MSDQTEKPEDKKQELREISDESLGIILAEHEKWLETKGAEGLQADLSWHDLRGKDFSECKLSQPETLVDHLRDAGPYKIHLEEAVLTGADLRDAQLSLAKLQGAFLLNADIAKAYLVGADLQDALMWGTKGIGEAYLDNCNMEGAKGLQGHEFARADVTGAKLPEDIAKWKVLDVVAETSKNARKIFLAMLLACVYSWLTIGSTTDVNLLTNSASSPLPIIGTAIPIAWFYFAAPLLLVGLYFYLHFYLQRLWENLAGLPAIFEDGKRLDQRAYPWLLNGLVRRHFDILRGRRTPLQRLEEWITIFLAWWVAPLTLLLFWVRYLPRHDWGGTYLQIGASLVTIAVGFAFYTTHARTLRGETRLRLSWKTAWKDTRIWRTLGSLAFGAGLIGLSHGSINGVRPEPEEEADLKQMSERVPWLFEQFGYDVFADLYEATVSARPANYWLLDPNLRDSSVTGANLRARDLRQANLVRAFLAKADLRGADLRRVEAWSANLREAKLQAARLDSAFLEEADLRGADLRWADLIGAGLWRADLSRANLTNANLEGADLHGVDLSGADLIGAFLAKADLRFADLRSARAIGANLSGARLWLAQLDSANLEGANLRGADLGEAWLVEAVLWDANLRGAKLVAANLEGARLRGADLSGAVLFDSSSVSPLSVRDLTQQQLDEACGDSLTVLPPGFTIKPCPCEDSTGTATDSSP